MLGGALSGLLSDLGIPILGGVGLLVALFVWYRFGKTAGRVTLILAVLGVVIKRIRKDAVSEKIARDHARQIKEIEKATSDRLRARDRNNSGGLLDDDGFKRRD